MMERIRFNRDRVYVCIGIIIILLGIGIRIVNYERQTITLPTPIRLLTKKILNFNAPELDRFPHHFEITSEVVNNVTIEQIYYETSGHRYKERTTVRDFTLENETKTFTIYPEQTMIFRIKEPQLVTGSIQTTLWHDSWNYTSLFSIGIGFIIISGIVFTRKIFTNIESAKLHSIILMFLIISTCFFAFCGFLHLWYDQATSLQTQEEVQRIHKKEIIGIEKTTTIVIENYTPEESSIQLFVNTFPYDQTYLESRLNASIKVNEVNYQLFYGDEPLTSPIILKQPIDVFNQSGTPINGVKIYDYFIEPKGFLTTFPEFSKIILTIYWNYSWSSEYPLLNFNFYINPAFTPQFRVFRFLDYYIYGSRERTGYLFYPFGEKMIPFPLNLLILTILFVVTGLTLSYKRSKRLQPIEDANNVLVQLAQENPNESTKLKSSLQQLTYGTNLFGFGWEVAFAPAIALFKMIIRNRVQKLVYISKLKDLKWEEESLETFLANPATNPTPTLFEARSITLILGFLTSIGLTFSWNVGAIQPFLFSLGLFYICSNLGFLLFMIKKSRKDVFLVLFLVFIVVMIAILPEYFTSIRVFI